MKVSVIIPVYNGEKTLEECLTSIENCHDPDFEILVVDDCSSDQSREIAQRFPHVRLVALESRSGAGGARAMGVDKAIGEIIAFTDADCIVPPDWLANLRKYMTPKIAGVGGLYKVDKRQNFMGRYATYDLHNFWFGWLPESPDHLATGNCAYWKHILVKVDHHQQDNDVFRGMAAAEDTLLGLLVSREHPLLYRPDLYIQHQSPERFKVWFKQQTVRGFSRTIVSRMHFKDKVLQTRDISLAHILMQLGSTCATIIGVGIVPFEAIPGLVIIGISLCIFMILQLKGLKFIYSEEKKISSVLLSIPMIFIRNVAWSVGCLKGVFYLVMHPRM